MIYCKQLDPVDGIRQFVRVDCPLDLSHMPPAPVTGQLCFFGDMEDGRVASFDVAGDFYSQEGSDERRLTNSAIQGFQGSTTPRRGDTQVRDAQTTVLRDTTPDFEGYVVTRLDWEFPGEEVLVGCEFDWDSEVP